MKRILIVAAVVGACAIGIALAQPPPGAGGGLFPPMDKIEKVADNLYLIAGGGGNSVVWVRADGVLLVDSKLAGNSQKLLDLIGTVTDKPVTHIVNTHLHGDHTGGNSFFPTIVEGVTQANAAASMQKMDSFKGEGRVGLPDHTFNDRLTLFSGEEAVDLYYFGRAHTNGDAFVVFHGARVMHAGDVFAGKGLPLIVDANNGGSGVQYAATIAKAVAGIKNVDTVITGHGAVMKWQDFVDYGEFHRLLLEHERHELAAGKTAEQTLESLKLPQKFADYMLDRPDVIRTTFEELQR